MKNFASELINQLEQKLSLTIELIEENPLEHGTQAIEMCTKEYYKLRKQFLNSRLSESEEIEFFKEYKPKLTRRIIYFNEIYKIEYNKPAGTKKTIQKYYNYHLKKREQFFIDNAEFYKYFKRRHTYLDSKYFLRNQQDCSLALDSFYFQLDQKFSTSHDYKAAQIMANEDLQCYLIAKSKKTESNSTGTNDRKLQWTGSKVGLVELIFALHTAGVFNFGTSDVAEIAHHIAKAFQIELGQIHRTFYEIAARKNEPTKFLNQLQNALKERILQGDAIKRLP
ncbi:RteC domain-containing protein [Flavobacterium sp.]|uniref:RteC domain-containing protein n=1 Tax=Flavobacterium sp. TaxID=239 RepID=UPI002FDB90D9